jgi:hypothetical protein
MVSGQEAGARLVLRVAGDPPSVGIHGCWAGLLRALVLPIGVCVGRPVGSLGALARGGRRWRARPVRRERSGGGRDGCSAQFSRVPAVALRLMGVDFPGRRLGRPGGAPIKSPRNA